MQDFKLIETYLEDLGFYRPSINRSRYKCWGITLYLSMIVILVGIATLNFQSGYDFAKGFFVFSSTLVIDVILIILMLYGSDFYMFIDKVKEIIQKRTERPDLKLSYQKMNKENVKYVKLMSIFLLINTLSPATGLFFYMLFIYSTRGLTSDDYTLILPLPFDWKSSLLSYSIVYVLEFLSMIICAKAGPPVMSLLVETFLVLSEFNKDIRRELAALNENWKINQNQVEIMQKLSEVIWFNIRLNEIINEFKELFQALFFINLTWSLFSICDSFLLLNFELSKETIDFATVGASIAAMSMSFALIFCFTELGEQLDSRSIEIDEAICELDWNTFPLQVQRMMPMILLTTQNPMRLETYGGIPLSRETFKKVTNTAYSYFTVFSG